MTTGLVPSAKLRSHHTVKSSYHISREAVSGSACVRGRNTSFYGC